MAIEEEGGGKEAARMTAKYEQEEIYSRKGGEE